MPSNWKHAIAVFGVGVIVCVSPGSATLASGRFCCKALSLRLGNKVYSPSDQVYTDSLKSYYAQQEEELSPDCIVKPTSREDVATAVRILSAFDSVSKRVCPFAIRGGGHTPFAGSANINKGVTIDLRSIKDVKVSLDRSITSVGAGALWGDVYTTLDPMSLSVIGGRVSSVGVGGLTTGVNYEIVLAGGKIVDANATERPDLWRALRGGSNNFGVVTRFDLRTFSQGSFWGGLIQYNISFAPEALKAFSEFNKAENYDEYASLIQNFGFVGGLGFGAANSLEYTRPVESPSVFDAWTNIQPKFVDTLRVSNLADFTNEQATFSPNGFRQFYITTTFKNDLGLLTTAYDLWNSSVDSVANVRGISYALTFQPIPPAITSKSAPLGGNSLGLDPNDGSLVLCLLTMTYDRRADDALVKSTGQGLINRIDTAAREKGLDHPFKYLNYAAADQKPIEGYGANNVANLRAVSRKYDPEGLFQTGVPGGFKLFR
ncbi:MAG: hypothetical protein M1837_004624 [Sclerophora amabilis]|nr:MAG: hypothetical protein M1837_004624 [Sclerophora amabilis]